MALITLDLSDEAVARLKDAAARSGLSEGAVVEQALALGDAEREAWRAFVAEGVAAAEAGAVRDFDEVMDEIDAIITEAEAKHAAQ
ncbi:MAG: hypothetical protein K2X11_03015 [Acetobacteraceae bacterium]|nr:hypothetical protein [Acetobacteraceae bacterium]